MLDECIYFMIIMEHIGTSKVKKKEVGKNVKVILLHFPTSNAVENTQRCFVMYIILKKRKRERGGIAGGRKAKRSVLFFFFFFAKN